MAAGTLTACGATQNKQGGDGTLSAAKGSSSQYFEPGERTLAPALKGTTLDGEHIDIADLRGHVVVINVWGSWCAPCRKEAPELVRLAEKTEPLGVRFLGVNIRDNKSSAKAFEEDYGVPYPSIYDTNSRTLLGFKQFAPRAVPTTYVLDKAGTVAAIAIGPLTYRGFLPIIEGIEAEGP
ncbi:thioredoxin family protein [Streptomyces sp. TRM68367]|uniref:TlpA family protein disulfide reductase n=1 Tax=Streptomyces sp. TRM68367 TaxID=2758415 RepID=UPI00165BA5ED|nr:TlpA disulfide reductase family protein [Streptomyces sp. TRM68367]MBC9725004.1 TlpA family protein disulfide reductase [Streptomyces sp. TRM68367]